MVTAQRPSNYRVVKGESAVHLQERDLSALALMSGLRVARLDDLSTLLSHLAGSDSVMRVRTARTLVARWVQLGYATTQRNPRGGLGIVASTLRTAQAVGGEALPHGLPAWRDVPHALTVSAVAIDLLARVSGDWTSDAHLLASGMSGHRVDGVLTLPSGHEVAVEVERTTKSASRWTLNLTETLDRFPQVVYYCSDPTARHLTAWADKSLTQTDRKRLSITPLGRLSR